MEDIPLTRMSFVLKQCIKIDRYRWYCQILKEHAVNGIKVYGIPAPVFVAQRMAYLQERDNFGLTEMKEFLSPLCNIAYLLNRQSGNLKQLQECRPTFNLTFNEATCKDILLKEMDINNKIKAHINLIDNLRNLQKTKDSYDEAIKEEIELRKTIVETVATIKDKIIETTRKGLLEAHADLSQAVSLIEENNGLKLVKDQLEEFEDVLDFMVAKLYTVTCAKYTAPIHQDFLQASHNRDRIQYTRSDFIIGNVRDNSFLRKFKKEKTDGCFYPRSGGFYVEQELYKTKAKLSLMDNTIGFGWTRCLISRSKEWGFFQINPKECHPESGSKGYKEEANGIPQNFKISEENRAQSITDDLVLNFLKEENKQRILSYAFIL